MKYSSLYFFFLYKKKHISISCACSCYIHTYIHTYRHGRIWFSHNNKIWINLSLGCARCKQQCCNSKGDSWYLILVDWINLINKIIDGALKFKCIYINAHHFLWIGMNAFSWQKKITFSLTLKTYKTNWMIDGAAKFLQIIIEPFYTQKAYFLWP